MTETEWESCKADKGGRERNCYKIDVREPVHRDMIVKITNKMQLYRLIYYTK